MATDSILAVDTNLLDLIARAALPGIEYFQDWTKEKEQENIPPVIATGTNALAPAKDFTISMQRHTADRSWVETDKPFVAIRVTCVELAELFKEAGDSVREKIITALVKAFRDNHVVLSERNIELFSFVLTDEPHTLVWNVWFY